MARAAQLVLIELINKLVQAGEGVKRACELAGVPRPSYYRIDRGYRHYSRVEDPVPHKERVQPAALTQGERDQIVAVLAMEAYADLSVVQAFWRAFDAGQVACSQRTFYRVAGEAGLVGDRRRTRGGGCGQAARSKPRVYATRPGQAWSWDITEFKGPRSQDKYLLLLVIDVFSRFPVAWRIAHHTSAALAVEMFAEAIASYGAPEVVHSDNGSTMRSHELVDMLAEQGVVASYSRPRVSDDNPFSESLFKTIKYDLNCPARFEGIEHARSWTRDYLGRYATAHRHSGLGWQTPAAVFDGTAAGVHAARQAQLDRIYAEHPERFTRRPMAPGLPGPTGINIDLSQTG